ncbi:uncharacterized protein LOC135205562 [Macrobrachium nipponense]|uniref:uncharacterized protein LOC135205562 n=1 Tax=Macrobrachium nipponense TaxID=159736 RepID=UPI0030C85EB8
MTSPPKEYTAILLALIDIEKDMSALGNEDRIAIAKMCNEAVTNKVSGLQYTPNAERHTEYIGKIEGGSMGVQIVVSQEDLQVHCEEYRVSLLRIGDLRVMMSFPRSEANLVVIGRCEIRGKTVAFVFDLFSDQLALECIQDISKNSLKKEDNDSFSRQKNNQPTVQIPSSLNPVIKGATSSPLPVAFAAAEAARHKQQENTARSSSVSMAAYSGLPHEGQFPPSHQNWLKKSVTAVDVQSTKSSQSVSTPDTSKSGVPKTPDLSRDGKRAVSFPFIYGDVLCRPLPLSTATVTRSPLRKNSYQIPFKPDLPPLLQKPVPSSVLSQGHQINKPSTPPKPDFVFKNQQELMEKITKLLKPPPLQSLPNTETENIYESIESAEEPSYIPISGPSPAAGGVVSINGPPEAINQEHTVSSPINCMQIQGQTAKQLSVLTGNKIIPSSQATTSIKTGVLSPTNMQKQREPPLKTKPSFLAVNRVKVPEKVCGSGVQTVKVEDGSNAPKRVEEMIRIFNENTLQSTSATQHPHGSSLLLTEKKGFHQGIPDSQKAEDMQPSVQRASKVTDDSHQSDNSSEFSFDLNVEEQGIVADGNCHSLKSFINRFLMNDFAYIETIERISNARNSLPPKMKILLRGVENLYETHVRMYHDLSASGDSCTKIANVFISNKERLEFYKYYMLNAPEICNHLLDLPDTVKANHPQLEDDIKSTWKRLHYYYTTLENMLSLSQEEEKDPITVAIYLIKNLNLQADSGILLDYVREAPYNLHLKKPLLLHNLFKIKGPSLKGSFFHALLFSEMIVITAPRGDYYVYQKDIYIQQIIFRDKKQSNKFILEMDLGRNKIKATYTFKTNEVGVKEAWFNEIKRLKYTIAEKERTERNMRFGIVNV